MEDIKKEIVSVKEQLTASEEGELNHVVGTPATTGEREEGSQMNPRAEGASAAERVQDEPMRADTPTESAARGEQSDRDEPGARVEHSDPVAPAPVAPAAPGEPEITSIR